MAYLQGNLILLTLIKYIKLNPFDGYFLCHYISDQYDFQVINLSNSTFSFQNFNFSKNYVNIGILISSVITDSNLIFVWYYVSTNVWLYKKIGLNQGLEQRWKIESKLKKKNTQGHCV